MKQNQRAAETKGNPPESCTLSFDLLDAQTLVIKIGGSWTLRSKRPDLHSFKEKISQTGIARLLFDTRDVADWDSALLTFLSNLMDYASKKGLTIDQKGLPEGARKLLKMAKAVPSKKEVPKESAAPSFLFRVGAESMDLFRASVASLTFVGDVFYAFLKFSVGQARFRRSDLIRVIQDCGIDALAIVSLISLLVGLILAFVGAVQLMMFGAQIYVANLVGIAMVRVMGAVMTGIIMAGRTGAAFAAQLGTMQVNEEIDAFKTMGISPMEFLVLPRMLGLTLMMPLLCLYADLMGILGGLIVAVGMLDLNMIEYYNQTQSAVSLADLWIGLIQSAVFGVLIALSGCLRGMQCGRSASAVGDAATSAVVTGIVSIIVATAVITVITNVMGV